MTVTKDDFEKIWASSSPLTPYEFSESQYKEGWNFVGSTPPSRQMWDFLQKNNDEKMQYLADNYLPLSGGTMSGIITHSNDTAIKRSTDSNAVVICGASADNKGASLTLFGKDYINDSRNSFSLTAHDGTNEKYLQGKADGTLKWGGNDILTSAIGCRCIKGYADGAGVFKLNVTGNNGLNPFAVVVSFGGINGRALNRVFVCNGYGPGGSVRTSYWRVPFPADADDGAYTVAVASNKNEITFTKTETTTNVSYTVLILNEYIYGDVQFTFTPA